jgi:lysophospholipase L1-like esterase
VALLVGCGGGEDAGGGSPATGGTGGAVAPRGGAGGNATGPGGGGASGAAAGTGGAGGLPVGHAGASGAAAGAGGAAAGAGGAAAGAGGVAGASGAPGVAGAAGGAPDGGAPDGGAVTEGGAPGVRLEGRFDLTDATRPAFSWSGSAIFARFDGTGATLRIDGSPNQFAIVVDGTVRSSALKVVSGTTQYSLATGLAAGLHDLVVWRRTEGSQGDNRFLGLDVTGGALQAPPAPPARRLEIYGDSISAGYGMDGNGPSCPFTPDTENHYLTYGALTARSLSAELHTIAWSGIGMYRNYNVSGASPDAMPAVYARTLATQAGSSWSFAGWQPHAVIINLGTNDASTKGDPGTPYRTAYLDFVRALRQKYPDTYFVLTIGPMLDGDNLKAIKGHLQAVITARAGEGDTRMSFLEFPVQSQSDGLGCDWHPSATTNAKMSALLVAELKTRLGW